MARSASVLHEELKTVKANIHHSIAAAFNKIAGNDDSVVLKVKNKYKEDVPEDAHYLRVEYIGTLSVGPDYTRTQYLGELAIDEQVDLLQALELDMYKIYKPE